jgi:hypothetical protein
VRPKPYTHDVDSTNRPDDVAIKNLPISGDDVVGFLRIRELLTLCDSKTWDQLHAALPDNAGDYMIVLGVLDHAGLIDYGVSVNYPWRTELGEKVLARLHEKCSDPEAAELYSDQLNGLA